MSIKDFPRIPLAIDNDESNILTWQHNIYRIQSSR